MSGEAKGLIFDIKRDCSEDGPGIRTTVFFKGCHLACVWCHNPEGISARPAISFSSDRCDPAECGGYACLDICPSKVASLNPANNKVRIDHVSCTRCDKCFDICTPKALEPVGSWWTVKELTEKVLVDKKLPAGEHRVTFHAASLPPGNYYCRLQMDSGQKTKRMVKVW